MDWKAKPNPIVWRVAALGLGLLALFVWLARGALGRPLGLLTFWIGLGLALSLLFVVLVAYWFWVQHRLRYHLDRNAFSTRCPLAQHRVPLSAITGFAPRGPERAVRRFRGLRLWGCCIGYGELGEGGRAWFCTTQPAADQWIVSTPALSYVITPADPESLLAAYQEKRALGPTHAVEQGQSWTGPLRWALWRDSLGLALLGLALWLNAALFAHVSSHGAFGGDSLAGWASTLRWPIVSLAVLLGNGLLGLWLHKRHRVATYMLLVAGTLVQVLAAGVVFADMPPTPGAILAYRLVGGLCLSAVIAGLAYRKEALAPSGALGAVIVGTAIFGFGGWDWGLLLIAFFVSSSLLSSYRRSIKETLADKFAKGSRRDLGQVLANGGLGAILALASYFWPHSLWLPAFLGVMATVNADTWATEIGVLSKRAPRLITTWKAVPIGTSGGVSLLGTAAALGGGGLIGLLALILIAIGNLLRRAPLPNGLIWLPVVGLAGGLFGALADSLLGATVQGIYYCDRCDKETERPVHLCGERTRHLRGWTWLDNDWVNLLSSAAGGAVAALLAQAMGWVW